MYKLEIDGALKCNLFSSDKYIEDRTNIIYVPGFGSLGKKRSEVFDRLIETNSNIITFLYKSHQGTTLDRLEGDIDDLGQVVHKLKGFGMEKKDIAFLGVCYGSYLTAQHLSVEESYRSALLVEPFLGIKSLKPYARFAIGVGDLLSKAGLSIVPVGHRYNEKGYANPGSVIDAICRDIPTIKGTPVLTLAADYHFFLNRRYMEDWTKQSGGSFKLIKEKSKTATLNAITEEVRVFGN